LAWLGGGSSTESQEVKTKAVSSKIDSGNFIKLVRRNYLRSHSLPRLNHPAMALASGIYSSLRTRFHHHSRAITQDFRDSGAELGRVIAHTDDGIGAKRDGVLAHLVEGIQPGALAQACINADIAADQRLQGSPDIPDDAAGPNNNAANQTKMPRHPISFETESRRAQKRSAHRV
jgi:hypothetical protein